MQISERYRVRCKIQFKEKDSAFIDFKIVCFGFSTANKETFFEGGAL